MSNAGLHRRRKHDRATVSFVPQNLYGNSLPWAQTPFGPGV
jgi:hypothetical protein